MVAQNSTSFPRDCDGVPACNTKTRIVEQEQTTMINHVLLDRLCRVWAAIRAYLKMSDSPQISWHVSTQNFLASTERLTRPAPQFGIVPFDFCCWNRRQVRFRRFSEPPRPDVVFDECEVVDYPGGFLGTQQLGTDWQITMSFFELMSLCKRGHVLMLSEGCGRLYMDFFPHGFLKRRFSRRERPKRRKYAPSMRGRRSRADAKNAVSCCIGSTNKSKIGGLCTPFQLLSLSSFEANTCFFLILSRTPFRSK